ncbi:MAG: right-handed parallel beta-helix repeat-containing protein [Pseudomonadales bacterium]
MKYATFVRLPRALCSCLVLALFSASAQGDAPTPVSCGDTLMTPGKYVLTSDLVCDPPAITIMASRVHLNMKGYSITNALPFGLGQSGVVVTGSNGHVVNGAVHGFLFGLLITGDENKITNVTASGNLIGMFLCCDAEANRVIGNTANNNLSAPELEVVGVGIQDWDGAKNNIIKGNTANGNDAIGFLIGDFSPPPIPMKSATITGNTANYNGDNGIVMLDGANGNLIRGNEFVGNTNFGIASGSFTNNFPVDNLIQGNTAVDNGNADVADFDPACANTWKSNTFATEGGVDPSCTD